VQESFDIVPPPENVQLPAVTPEQRAANDRRFAYEDSLRHAYEATFPTPAEALAFVREHGYDDRMASYIVRSRGNADVIKTFMAQATDPKAVEDIFSTLSTKDFHDIPAPILFSYYTADPFRGARIENEFLSDYYGFFQSNQGSTAAAEKIRRQTDPTAWRIPMSPEGVWKSRMADPRSLDIFTVALLRARGKDARKNPVTGVLETREEGGAWKSLSGAPGKADPKGTLRLTFTPTSSVDNPQYYSHFTLSKIVDGRPSLLSFDEGEVDMGGGTDWEHAFKQGCQLDEGTYLLVSGNRLSDGSVPVSMRFFEIKAGEETVEELRINENVGALPVIGSFDAENKIQVDGEEVSILSQVGRGFYVLAVLDPGKEPTNHALRDIAAARDQLETWGRPILLLCTSEKALQQLHKEEKEGRYGKLPTTVLYGVAPEEMLDGARPVVLMADSFNRVFFQSKGYTIGLGNQLSAASTALK
jgi:hypothetical protein